MLTNQTNQDYYFGPLHRHTTHAHIIDVSDGTGGTSKPGPGAATGSGTQISSSVDGGSGVSTDSLEAPAYLVLNYIIKQ